METQPESKDRYARAEMLIQIIVEEARKQLPEKQ
jgi:hypothetical protein